LALLLLEQPGPGLVPLPEQKLLWLQLAPQANSLLYEELPEEPSAR
jgi:hypothetical protein